MSSLHRSPPRKSTVGIASAGLLFLAASAVIAAQPAPRPVIGLPAVKPTVPAPAPAAPVWVVDKAASRLGFQVMLGGQAVDGVFKIWDAQIAFDPKNLKASHATITVDTTSAMTGQPTRDALLPTPPWLSTRKFPKATLITHAIVQTAPGRYLASAELRLRGLTRRVSIPFTLSLTPTTGHMVGTMMLDRRAFGVGQVPNMPLTSLSPMVKLTLRLTAKREH